MSPRPPNQELERRVWQCLQAIDDPEMPISIVDLGIVDQVVVASRRAEIRITPTFTGCPALEMIDAHITEALQALPGIDAVCIRHVFDPPWSVERITARGRERLRKHGVTVPQHRLVQLHVAREEVVACPFCGSRQTRLDSPFGPTRCRMIRYCPACHNSFEHLKAV